MNWWLLYLFPFLFLALFFRAKAIYIVFYAVAILYFAGGKLLEYGFSRLRVIRTAGRTRLFPGETEEIKITFRNHSVVPLAWLSGYDRLPPSLEAGKVKRWVLSLGPLSKASVTYSITGRERGLYTVGPLEIAAGDPLGLHQCSSTIYSFHDVVVYPRIYPLTRLGLPSRLLFGKVKARQRLYPDPARLAGVRPYQTGDTWQSIHWKAAARTGQLQVKQFEHTVALDTVIILNLDERDYPVHSFLTDSELAIETAAALANHLAHLEEPFGFVTNARLQQQRALLPETGAGNQTEEDPFPPSGESIIRFTPRKGMIQLMQILEVLAAAICNPAPEFVSLVSNEARSFAWGATLLLVTPVDSPQLIDTALSLVKSGYHVLIFVVGKRVIHEQLLYRPAHASLQLFRVTKEAVIRLESRA